MTDAIEQARYEARMRSKHHARPWNGGGEPCASLLHQHPHAAIESMWFNYAIDDVPAAIEQATEQAEVEWFHDTTDPWTLSITAHRD